MRTRSRACAECHRLKIKCDLSTNPSGAACDRCSRNSLECVPSAPRLQRDRIAELEAQVQDLKNALQNQDSSPTPSRSPGSFMENHDQIILAFLDMRIPLRKQQELLHLFTLEIGASWPVLLLPVELDVMRSKSPILLLTVLAYTVTHRSQGTDLETHDELVRETMYMLGEIVIGRGQRSLVLVQALLVAAFWNKSPRQGG